MKKLFKSKRFLAGVFSLVLLGAGVANNDEVGQIGAEIVCGEAVKCDA